jgi:hypothetical protein
MEHSGKKDRIQISQETAELLDGARKRSWYTPRHDAIESENKGRLVTYWLKGREQQMNDNESNHSVGSFSENAYDIAASYMRVRVASSVPGGGDDNNDDEGSVVVTPTAIGGDTYRKSREKSNRLIEWNCEVLLRLLGQIAQRRYIATRSSDTIHIPFRRTGNAVLHATEQLQLNTSTGTVLDEVKEIIELPEFDSKAAVRERDNYDTIELDPIIEHQLKDFIMNIASGYHDNPCKFFFLIYLFSCAMYNHIKI